MAESKNGGSSAGKSKEKDSMLDLDFGNDFLTSWKTTSKVGDDGIDLDFGPVSKGKNKAFDFKKGDIDFDLGDFGNMPSFDLDISSPVKKDANSKKKPEEESTTGNNKAKADRFSFGFDFPDLDSFSFKSSPKKHDAKEKKDEPKKNSLEKSETQEYADHPREENDSRDSETTRNPSTQVGDAAAAGSETGNHITNTHDKGQQNSTTVSDKTSAYEELTMFEKTKNVDKQQSDSQLHKVSPEEACIPIEAALEVSAHSTSAAKSSKESMSELQEDDVDSGSVVINQGDKQCFDKNEMVNTSSSSGGPVHSEPSLQHGLSPQNANGGIPNSGDVHTSVGKKDGQKNIHIESLVGLSSASTAMKEFTSGKHGQIKSQSLLDDSAVSKGSGATASNLIPEKEKEALTVRSKYFKAADKSGDQLHNALNQRKLSSLSEKQVVTKQQHHKDERLGNAKEDQNDGVIPDKPLAQLESRVSTEHSDKESQEGSQSLLSSGSMSEDVNKGKLVSRGRESNAKTLDSSRLTVLTEKSRSENSPNSETSAPKVATTQTKTSHTSLVDNGASLRTKVQTPNLSYLKISRPTGPNTDRPKPLPQDYIKSSNVNQNKVLVGVKPSKVDQFVGIKKQAPPTSIHSIKRKRVESPDINVISKCPKHSLLSPILRQTEENSTEDMDIEALGDKNGVGNRKTSTPNSLQSPKLCNSWEANGMELEVPYSMEKDDNVEKAEAITKELDNICNMLRKKHEEAKEVLVRAIVSNNKLLMLNHPMHDEKIRIVQRFAKQLTLKEIDTHT